MTEIFRPTFLPSDKERFVGHWTEDEIASTGVSWQCIAAFLAYIHRVTDTAPQEADKEMVIQHIKEALAEDPGYDRWANG